MPLRKLQEIIIDYAQHLYREGRFRALQFSVDYPYKGPAFAFTLEGNRLEIVDNTQEPVKSQNGRETMERVDHGRFRKPRRNQVKAAFLKFRYWENKILKNREDGHAGPDKTERELEIITGKLVPFAVAILESTAESYSLPETSPDKGQDCWTHPSCDLACRPDMLESGENVPAEIQVKVEEFNDLLRETQRQVEGMRATGMQQSLSRSPEASQKVVRLLQEMIVDYAGAMILAGQRKDAEAGAVLSEDSQYGPLQTAKNGTSPLPAKGGTKREATHDQKMGKTATRDMGVVEASPGDRDSKRQQESRKKQTGRQEAKTKCNLISSAARRKAVEAYIAEVFDKTGKRITRADIWKSARYKDRTDFERWQRNDPRATKSANERFSKLLKEKPHLK